MERIVIAAYRPKAGQEEALRQLVLSHWAVLHSQGLVSARQPIIGKAQDSTIVEVFGWKSQGAIDEAHSNPTVQQLWAEFAKVCDFIPVGDVHEASLLFSELTPI